MHKLKAMIRAMMRDKRANVAVITGLCALPLFGIFGLALDYSLAIMTKAKLDGAADAAAVAAIYTAQAKLASTGGNSSSALTDGAARGLEVFKANMGQINFAASPPVPTIGSVVRSGQTLTQTVSYTMMMKNNFGNLFNVPTTKISGTSTASLTIGQYLDFYLLLDVSGSMGFPSTTKGAADLAAVNPDEKKGAYPSGCTFACHVDIWLGFKTARDNKIQLRADAVGNSVCQFIATAINKRTLPNQYRVGIYPFIVDMETFSPLSSDLDHVMSDVNGATSGGCSTSTPASAIGNLLDTGEMTSPMGAGGTHFEIVLPHMSSTIASVGDGSSLISTKPFVFLVTDGMQDNQGSQGPQKDGVYWWSKSTQPQLMDPMQCAILKNRGVIVAVLNIPYYPIEHPNPSYIGNEDGKVNALISGVPSVSANLKKCASDNFYFTASTPDGITDAMNKMFAQSIAKARITN